MCAFSFASGQGLPQEAAEREVKVHSACALNTLSFIHADHLLFSAEDKAHIFLQHVG
jgi:hypothetical protein